VQEDVRQDGSAGAFFCTNWHIRKKEKRVEELLPGRRRAI